MVEHVAEYDATIRIDRLQYPNSLQRMDRHCSIDITFSFIDYINPTQHTLSSLMRAMFRATLSSLIDIGNTFNTAPA